VSATLPAVAVKAAVVTPEATVTLAGTDTEDLLLDSVTTALPEAALVRVTVQLDVAPLAIVAGRHFKVVAFGASTVTVVWAVPL
jgi:hypothetical protein